MPTKTKQTEYKAITNAKIATIYQGKRIVRFYRSGEKLVGKLPQDDAPPFTGYVRDWFKKEGRTHVKA